jgi:hypothetical protein
LMPPDLTLLSASSSRRAQVGICNSLIINAIFRSQGLAQFFLKPAVMSARFVQLLVAAIVILPSTAHSTLPPASDNVPGVQVLTSVQVEATPAPERAEVASAVAELVHESAPAEAAPAHESAPAEPPAEGNELVECPVPGKRQNLQGKIDPAVIRTAATQLELPLGRGRRLSINGRAYLFCIEAHYREPGSGPGPQGWHHGVTVYGEP